MGRLKLNGRTASMNIGEDKKESYADRRTFSSVKRDSLQDLISSLQDAASQDERNRRVDDFIKESRRVAR
jgi:hypothetical protein